MEKVLPGQKNFRIISILSDMKGKWKLPVLVFQYLREIFTLRELVYLHTALKYQFARATREREKGIISV